MMRRTILATSVALMASGLCLAACGGPGSMTPYALASDGGALFVEEGKDGTILVRAMGNGYTPQAAMADYAMLKAAEITLERGKTCFEVVGSGSQMNSDTYVSQYGATVTERPAARVRFRLTEKTTDCGEGDAQAVVSSLRARVLGRTAYFQD